MNKPRTVITYGTFDMFHIGHENIIRRAKELANGGKLIVGVTIEKFNIERGKTDVQDSYEKRCANVMATGYVDEVIPDISFPQKEIDIKTHNVDLVVMGHDWEGKFDYCKDWCDVVYLQRTPEISTTILKEQMREGISKSLNAELRERYNPDGSVLRKLQMRELDILLYVDKICKENNIQYWLCAGTLLGAVRHEGFIPWDDDIDIEMSREDYLRFEKIFKESDDYVLQTYKNDPYYMMPYAKVRDKHSIVREAYFSESYKYQGVFVDIFPMEYTHKFMNAITYLPIRLLSRCEVRYRNSRLCKFLSKPIKTFAYGQIWIIRGLMKLVPGKKFGHTYGAWYYKVERCKQDIFPLTTVIFEGREFPAPHDVDAYLRRQYGDYMKIPDKKEAHMQRVDFLK
jgi:lipopolysaccharide cholinephosphotransferase